MKEEKCYKIQVDKRIYECSNCSVIELDTTLLEIDASKVNKKSIRQKIFGAPEKFGNKKVKTVRLDVKDAMAPTYIISKKGARSIIKRFQSLEYEEMKEGRKILKGGRPSTGKPKSEDKKFVESCDKDFLDAWGVGYKLYNEITEEGNLIYNEFFDDESWIGLGSYEPSVSIFCASIDKERIIKTEDFDNILRQVEKYEEEKCQIRKRIEQEYQVQKETEEKERQLKEQDEKERQNRIFLELSKQIEEDFEQKGLLNKAALSTRDKCEEYEQVRKLCIEYLPELGQKEFRLEEFWERYQDCIDAAQFKIFSENWNRLYISWRGLKRGINGEEKVAEVLSLYDDRLCFLKNYAWGYEHDFIVLAPSGIFTIEVKTLRGDYVLTETGILKSVSCPNEKGIDVVLQSKKHLESLRRKLKACPLFHEDIPIQEIVCSGEGNFTIENKFPAMPVCYYNTLDSVIFSASMNCAALNQETIEGLRDFLLQHQEAKCTYDLFYPRGELDSREAFIHSFIAVAAGIKSANVEDARNKK